MNNSNSSDRPSTGVKNSKFQMNIDKDQDEQHDWNQHENMSRIFRKWTKVESEFHL